MKSMVQHGIFLKKSLILYILSLFILFIGGSVAFAAQEIYGNASCTTIVNPNIAISTGGIRVDANSTKKVSATHDGVERCREVTNNEGGAIFVPDKTAEEICSFFKLADAGILSHNVFVDFCRRETANSCTATMGMLKVSDADNTGSEVSVGNYNGFGTAVAFDGTTIVVGVPKDDDGGNDRGAIYILEDANNNDTFENSEIIKVSDTSNTGSDFSLANLSNFGSAVAVDGDTIVVGVPKDNDGGSERGAIYIFEDANDNGTFENSEIVKVSSTSNTGSDFTLYYRDLFGSSVAIDGDVIVVGAPGDDEGSSVNDFGIITDADKGAIYILEDVSNNGTFENSEIVKVSDTSNTGSNFALDGNDAFGSAVAVSGSTIIVGAPDDDDGGSNRGALYILKDANGNDTFENSEITKVSDTENTGSDFDLGNNDAFGSAIAISGDYIIAGTKDDDGGSNQGAIYIFTNTDGNNSFDNSGTTNEIIKVSETYNSTDPNFDLDTDDRFGFGVAIAGETILVGTPGDSGGGFSRGAFYILSFSGGSLSNWLNYCAARCAPAVDGGWSAWKPTRSGTCHNDTLDQTRECNNPAPSCGGNDCGGDDTQTVPGTKPTVHGGWSAWTPAQNSACGPINQTRFCNNPAASCGGRPCSGIRNQTVEGTKSPVHGGWSAWTPDVTPSDLCAGTSQDQTRECNNPAPACSGRDCIGDDVQTIQGRKPIIHGGWSAWTPSSSTVCRDNTVDQTRECNSPTPACGGNDCTGDDAQTVAGTKPAIHGGWSAWTPVVSASDICTGSSQDQTRECNSPTPFCGGNDCTGDDVQTIQGTKPIIHGGWECMDTFKFNCMP